MKELIYPVLVAAIISIGTGYVVTKTNEAVLGERIAGIEKMLIKIDVRMDRMDDIRERIIKSESDIYYMRKDLEKRGWLPNR